jgi:hypothetical protein
MNRIFVKSPFLALVSVALAVLVFGNTQAVAAGSSTDSSGVSFFPAHRIFPALTADGTAHQLGIAKDIHSRRWLGSIGAMRPVFQVSFGTIDIQAGIGATVQASILRKSPLLQVVTTDFFVDFPVDVRLTPSLTLRTGYGHYSAHLADDGIEQLGIPSINYAKDYVALLSAYMLPFAGGFVYGGGRMDFHTLPETTKHWTVQCGGEFGNIALLPRIILYGAVDLRFKEEAAWRSTQSYQLGLKFFEEAFGRLRITYTYRTGVDDRGQFYNQSAHLSLLGAYFDF